MSWQTVACCSDCWHRREGDRRPVRLTNPAVEACGSCSKPTSSGIYVRLNIDPQTGKEIINDE